MGNLKGWAVKKVITPTQEMLNGLSALGIRRLTGIYEDVYIALIVLDNGKEKFVLANAELGCFPGQQRLADKIRESYGIPVINIWLASTHNHQMALAFDEGEGPVDAHKEAMNTVYVDYVHRQLMDGIEEAINKLIPVRIGYGEGKSYINVSRECPSLGGTIQASNYAGYSDKTLSVLKMENLMTHEPMAIFANYAVHNNVLFGHLMNQTFTKAGGDLSGAICRYVEQALPGCVVFWGIAAGGDQNPIYMSFNYRCEHQNGGGYKVDVHHLVPEDSFLLMEQMASMQGQDIINIQSEMGSWMEDLEFLGQERYVQVRGRESYISCGYQRLMDGQTVDKVPAEPVNFRCRLALVGDIAFVGINCEAYSRLGTLIKEQLPFKKVIFIEMAYGHIGYVPDSKTEELNGFGTMRSSVYSAGEMEAAVLAAFRDCAKNICNQ